jgi:Tol biopolymer transport system component/predicted Ser/Thr protein kinase
LSAVTLPTRIGPYPVERELGRGGMGVVYLGRDPRLERPVAIKVLPDAFAHDPERVARFEREARLLASLHHANIGGIYGLEETDGRRFLTLEYVEGDTLAQRLAKGPLPLEEALEVGRQVAAALEAAHENGIIHRDLKPGNVKLTPSGEVKVLDFGLAKGGDGAGNSSDPSLSASPTLTFATTGVGVILGTAAYMSPEQARGKSLDRRTDIWSFGCVLYECLTGRPLFSGETVSDLIARILEREPDWSGLPPATPASIRHLLHRCLEKDAKRRLRDVGEARLEMENALAPRTSGIHGAPAIATTRGPRAGGGRIAWVLVAVFAISTLALGLPRMLQDVPTAAPVRFSIPAPQAGANLSGPGYVAISPDGRNVVFSLADTTSAVALWLRPLDDSKAHRLPGTENAQTPFWSPDSRSIGFFADGKLKKLALGGTAPEVLCDANQGRGGTWGPNHNIVFAPAGGGPLYQISDHGGDPVQVTRLDSTRHETAHRFPCFLPDGKRFLFMALPMVRGRVNVFVGSVDGTPARLVTSAEEGVVYADPGYLLFKHNGIIHAQRFNPRTLRLEGDPESLDESAGSSLASSDPAISVSRNGVVAHSTGVALASNLVWYSRSGERLGVVPRPPARYSPFNGIAISPDSRSAVASIESGANGADLWMLDLERGTSLRLTAGVAGIANPIVSPDGRTVAYVANPDGQWELFVKPADGSGSQQVVNTSGVIGTFKHLSSWSFDGRLLIFEALDPKTGFDLWVAPLTGDRKAFPYLRGPFNERFGSLSPDGHWMAYFSDESGRSEVYVQSFPTPGSKHQVSLGGGVFPVWRQDGKELIFGGLDVQSLMSVDVQTGEEFHSSLPHVLSRLPKNAVALSATWDFRRLLIAIPTEESAPNPIEVLLNWPAALAKR